jgi:hypothetical protein
MEAFDRMREQRCGLTRFLQSSCVATPCALDSTLNWRSASCGRVSCTRGSLGRGKHKLCRRRRHVQEEEACAGGGGMGWERTWRM